MDRESLKIYRIKNHLRSAVLLSSMISVVALLGWLITGAEGLKLVLIISGFMLVLGPRISPGWIMRWYGARPLWYNEAPFLHEALQELSVKAKLPILPHLYYVPSSILNAFTVGGRSRAAIAFTDGLLRSLEPRELIGVLAHEVSHIQNNDKWIMNLSVVLGQMVSVLSLAGHLLLFLNLPLLLIGRFDLPWFLILVLMCSPTLMLLLQMALSRTREFDADMGAANLTGDPKGLASALTKMESSAGSWWMKILFPGYLNRGRDFVRTHPDTRERVRRLLSLVERRPYLRSPWILSTAEAPLDMWEDFPYRVMNMLLDGRGVL